MKFDIWQNEWVVYVPFHDMKSRLLWNLHGNYRCIDEREREREKKATNETGMKLASEKDTSSDESNPRACIAFQSDSSGMSWAKKDFPSERVLKMSKRAKISWNGKEIKTTPLAYNGTYCAKHGVTFVKPSSPCVIKTFKLCCLCFKHAWEKLTVHISNTTNAIERMLILWFRLHQRFVSFSFSVSFAAFAAFASCCSHSVKKFLSFFLVLFLFLAYFS